VRDEVCGELLEQGLLLLVTLGLLDALEQVFDFTVL
jgi:hypothetical protein